MKPSRAVLTLSTLAFTLGISTAARAEEEFGLSFELEPAGGGSDVTPIDAVAIVPPAADPPIPEVDSDAPLPVPPAAKNPPFAGDTTRPSGVYGGGESLALSRGMPAQSLLPVPPPVSVPSAIAAAPPEKPSSTLSTRSVPERSAQPAQREAKTPLEEPVDGAIVFDLESRFTADGRSASSEAAAEETSPSTAKTLPVKETADTFTRIFQGGTESLVALAVGSAEGTRTPEGHKTPAYFGHVDPGNGVWNLGTFSYQHGAQTPEEADSRQLSRLQSQTRALKQKAEDHGLELTLAELLNGIDLANQAPLAALDRGGYVDWLAEARKLGMQGSEAIVWARTRSFIDPDTQRWNAPGLGNNIHGITHDQARRASAIDRAIQANALPTLAPTAIAAAESAIAPTSSPPPADAEEFLGLLFDVDRAFPTNRQSPTPATADVVAAATPAEASDLPPEEPLQTPPETSVSSPIKTPNHTEPATAAPSTAAVATVKAILPTRLEQGARPISRVDIPTTSLKSAASSLWDAPVAPRPFAAPTVLPPVTVPEENTEPVTAAPIGRDPEEEQSSSAVTSTAGETTAAEQRPVENPGEPETDTRQLLPAAEKTTSKSDLVPAEDIGIDRLFEDD